jgi:spermidine synthase
MEKRGLWSVVGMIAPLYFLLGAFSLVFQTILLREFFTVAAGNEISFGIALGGWLLGVGAGSFLAGFLSARPRHTANAFPWVVVVMCVSAPLLLVVIRCLQQISAVPQGALIPLSKTFWLIPLLTIPFSFFSGFAFPLAVRLEPALEPYNKFSALLAKKICYLRLLSPPCGGLRSSAGSVLSDSQKMVRAYIWECGGALVGGVAYTFWLLEKFNSSLIIALFTLPLLLGSLFVVVMEKRKKAFAAHFLLLALNLYAVLAGGAGRLDSWLMRQRWLGLSAATWVESRDSKYQNLQLGLSQGQYCLYSNGQLAAVFPDDDQQRILAAQIITQHPQPRRILIIGDGASGLAKYLLQYKITSLAAVEIDGEFLDLILKHLPANDIKSLRDPRLRMPVLDGRRFVMDAARAKGNPENRFDLIYLHQPDAWTAQLNRYYTSEFFLDLKAILNSGGVVAMRLVAAENYASEITSPYTATIYQTLKSVFPAIAISPGPINFFSASSVPASVSTSPAVLAGRYDRLAQPPADLEAIFNSLYPDEKTRFGKKALEQYQGSALNRDQRPIAYFLYGRLLGWTSGSPLSGLFDFFEKMKFSNLLIFIILLILPAVMWVWSRRKRAPGNFPILLAAASGGFAGLAFEILTIFTFQNVWGYVYQTIGLLIASFMLGMGFGASLTSRYLRKKQLPRKKARKILAVNQLLIVIASLTYLPLMSFFAKMAGSSGQIPLFSWLGGMGFLVGAILPLGLCIYGQGSAAKKAGFLNAADYLGGTIGALAMASFFVPLYGSANSLLLIAVPALTAALLLLLETGFNDPGSG